MVRTCKICEEEKELSKFSIHTRKGDKVYKRDEWDDNDLPSRIVLITVGWWPKWCA